MVENTKLQSLLDLEITQLDNLITDILATDCQLLTEISRHIFSSGGKRLRPLMLILMAKLFKYQGDNHIKFAAVLEIIHTATLLHDDVIDNSAMRRKKVSAHIKWGIRNSIIAGNWLFALAYNLACTTQNTKAAQVIANIGKKIVDGEFEQLFFKNKLTIDEQTYYRIIEAKTGLLFSGATEIAASLTEQSVTMIKHARLFGLHYGIAFQIMDDILDYLGDAELIGKNIGDDLLEGKLTLPMIYYKQHNKAEFDTVIKKLKTNAFNENDFMQLKQRLKDTGVIADCYEATIKHQNQALFYLSKLPQNSYTQCLSDLTAKIVGRDN